jgi:hypothetical protein
MCFAAAGCWRAQRDDHPAGIEFAIVAVMSFNA